jgi:hypothetical protein
MVRFAPKEGDSPVDRSLPIALVRHGPSHGSILPMVLPIVGRSGLPAPPIHDRLAMSRSKRATTSEGGPVQKVRD